MAKYPMLGGNIETAVDGSPPPSWKGRTDPVPAQAQGGWRHAAQSSSTLRTGRDGPCRTLRDPSPLRHTVHSFRGSKQIGAPWFNAHILALIHTSP